MESGLAYPQVRPDLIITTHEKSSGVAYVIKDARTRKYFRLLQDDYHLFSMFKGDISPEEAVIQLKRRHGLTVDVETVRSFIAKLVKAGLLTCEDPAPARRAFFSNEGVALFQRVLWIRLKAFDPDRLFTRIMPLFRFFFTWDYVLVASLVILAGISLVSIHLNLLTTDMRATFGVMRVASGVRLAAMFWILALSIAVMHECAHGLSCKFFGGEVHEIGILLIYFNLALYCNVSDAWLFNDRGKRFWVMFSGAFFEAFLWSVAALVWYFTRQGSAAHLYALIVVTISGVKNLVNLLPLIKLDGYYLLSDMLDIPNLRARSFEYGRRVIARVVLGQKLRSVPARERIAYILYAGAAVPFSTLLVAYMYFHFARFLVLKYGRIGQVMLLLLLVISFGDAALNVLNKLYLRYRRTGRNPSSPSQSVAV